MLKCFDIPIYNQKIWFGIADNIQELVDKFTSLDEKPDIGNAEALSGYVEDASGVRNYYIFVPRNYTHGMLAHEAFHVVIRMGGVFVIRS